MNWQEWVRDATEYFRGSWGLEATWAGQVALLYLYFASYGLAPRITSGYRDPAHQAELRRRWDAGDRAGLRHRPALNSDHTRRRAVDIVTNNPRRAAEIAKALGIGTGMDYGDDVHFFRKG